MAPCPARRTTRHCPAGRTGTALRAPTFRLSPGLLGSLAIAVAAGFGLLALYLAWRWYLVVRPRRAHELGGASPPHALSDGQLDAEAGAAADADVAEYLAEHAAKQREAATSAPDIVPQGPEK